MSEEMQAKRRLSAILFADIADYTALMQQDEMTASVFLKRFQKVMRETVQEHNGSMVNEMGDGMLCVFDSTTDAVQCAMALKQSFDQAPAIPVRLAVHSGQVTFEGTKIYGDSVNIASRIETMGVPGAVLISERVKNDIKNQSRIKVKSLGLFHFKNVEEPMKIYALANETFIVPDRNQIDGKFEERKRSLLKWLIPALVIPAIVLGLYAKLSTGDRNINNAEKSIAVLPFRNESPNKENQYFCNGMMEAILNQLSQIKDLRVISRTSTEYYRNKQTPITQIGKELNVRYLVEGSVQRLENRAVIFAQLIDTKNDAHLWSQSFDRNIEDVFSVQAEITKMIAYELEATIIPEVERRLNTKPTDDPIAYDYYLQAEDIYDSPDWNAMTYDERQDLLNKVELLYSLALSKDSAFAEAQLGVISVEYDRSFYRDYLESHFMDTIIAKINRVLLINPDLSDAYSFKSHIHLSRLEMDEAQSNSEKALLLNPNNPWPLSIMSQIYYWNLEFEKSLESLQEFARRQTSPDERVGVYWGYLSFFRRIGDNELKNHYVQKLDSLGLIRSYWFDWVLKREFEKGIARIQAVYPKETQRKLLELGNTYLYKKDYSKSIEYFNKWEKLMEKEPSDDWMSTSDWHRYGLALMAIGDTLKGLKMLNRQKDIYEKKLELRYLDYYNSMYGLAGIAAYLGNWEETYRWFEKLEKENGWFRNASISYDLFIDIDPLFDPIRQQPVFQSYVGRLKAQKEKVRQEIRDFLTIENTIILP